MTTPSSVQTPERVLRRLEWRVIRRLDGQLQGDYRTLLRGVGIDVADLREYEPGDDVRHIDWNVTARMDTPYVRTYLEDRELTAWLLLDRSPSMGFGPTDRPKETVLIEVATALARLLTRSGNRVGAILYNNAVERTIPPRNGRNQVLRLAHHLLQPAGAVARHATDLAGLLRAPAPSVARRRSLVVVISDFISEPGWERALPLLTERHEVVAIRLFDPRELELPDAGVIVVEDAETGELLSVDTSDPEFRRRFHEVADGARGRAAGAGQAGRRRPVRRLDRRRPRAGAVRIVEQPAAAEALMSFLWPRHARAPAGGAAASSWATCAPAPAERAAPPSSPPRGSCPTRRPGGCAGSATCPSVLFLAGAWCVLLVAFARPEVSVGLPAPRGHGDPRLRRLQQHAGQGPPADADGRGQGGGQAVRRASSRARSRSASSPSATAPSSPSSRRRRQGRRAGGHRPPVADRAPRRSARASSRRSAPSPASRSACRRTRPPTTSPTSTSATSARPPSCCCPTARTRRAPTPSPSPSWRRPPGVHIYPIGIGSPQGTVAPDRRLQRGHGARRAGADADRVGDRTASTSTPRTPRRSPQIYKNIDLRTVTDPKKTEVTALFAGVSTLLLLIGGALSMRVVRAVGVAMSFASPLALVAPAGRPAAARRVPVAAAAPPQAGGALLERRPHPPGVAAARRAGAATCPSACSWPPSPPSPSPRPARRSPRTCRSARRRSS